MTSCFKIGHDELVTYGEAVRRMYEIEALMLETDFGRSDPARVHEIARAAVGIPDNVSIARTPLGEWQEPSDR